MKKSVETFFALLLILVIGICLLQLSGASSALYNRLTGSKSDQDYVKISAAYLVTKIKQSDRFETVRVEDQRLVIDEGDGLKTYVYLHEDRFVESNLFGDLEPSIDNAFEIARLDALEIRYSGGMITFRVAKGDRSIESAVRIRSGGVR
ncbi:MAG: DUF4860 domain-containing protein [Bacillota bacterium]|nr:DUF4860 domain-containing protein [Bacillota bacterium]